MTLHLFNMSHLRARNYCFASYGDDDDNYYYYCCCCCADEYDRNDHDDYDSDAWDCGDENVIV